MDAIRKLLDEGVVVMAGISHAGVSQIDGAREVLGRRLVSMQDQLEPARRYREREAPRGLALRKHPRLGSRVRSRAHG
ncbi:hypothetical protein [Streptomyces canus]|uniref:hypothetical protein n=1 Tax=Streptomyces canus TaxID=58343 RepID=UPI000B1E67EA|nr:hypothetical protein [Streptomyces canus]